MTTLFRTDQLTDEERGIARPKTSTKTKDATVARKDSNARMLGVQKAAKSRQAVQKNYTTEDTDPELETAAPPTTILDASAAKAAMVSRNASRFKAASKK